MRKLKHARMLLQKAQNDFKALQGMLDPEIFTNEIFGFHAQQAIEKALKAWIDYLGLEYPITHNLSELMDVLKEHGVRIEGRKHLLKFNLYAVLFRYVSTEGKIEPLDRETAISRIGVLLKEIGQLLK
jgi:HEPN domain-containing protein